MVEAWAEDRRKVVTGLIAMQQQGSRCIWFIALVHGQGQSCVLGATGGLPASAETRVHPEGIRPSVAPTILALSVY